MSDGETMLWRQVLEQAYEDAETSPVTEAPEAESFICTKARRYLRADSPFEAESLRLVCDFADIPADRVVLWARQRYPVAA